MSTPERYLPIDEDGYFKFGERRVDDETLGRALLREMRYNDREQLITSMNGEDIFIEAFDAPLVVRHVEKAGGGTLNLVLPYGERAAFQLDTLSVDEWDRFHGVTERGLPFVLSRAAQMEFFDTLDAFDDESITLGGARLEIKPWLALNTQASDDLFWTAVYRKEKPAPGFDLGEANPILKDVLPQLKLSKSRVLVLGCGNGHDAAALAQLGHAVTAVDFSHEAIKNAQNKYGHIEGLNFSQNDIFRLPESWTGRFDLVFEHTCYCAVSPDKRSELIAVWRRMLHEQGHLLGIFFAYERRQGPPWGGSEWELRHRLNKNFDPLFWTRWRHSLDRRKGREVVVYARRSSL